MSKTNTLLSLAIAIALGATAPVMAQVKLGGAVRAETPVAQAHVGVHGNAQAATPATPAVPATPATPPVRSETGEMTPAVPATPATPAMPAQPAKMSWTELDANGNGTLSATEAAGIPQLEKVFAKADANADGELSADEYKAWLALSGKAKAKSGG